MAPEPGQPVFRRIAIPFAVTAGLVAMAAATLPAAAQNGSPRDFFPFFGGGFIRPPAPVIDSTRAPPSRKLEAPPATTVVVIGDSMADWLGYGLDETYADQPDLGVERKVRAYSGLIRYDSKNETQDWPQAIKDALATERPNAIIVMLGLNDRVSLRDRPPRSAPPQKTEAAPAAAAPATQNAPPPPSPDTEAATPEADAARLAPGGTYEFHTDQWAELYGRRVDDMINALKTKGVPVIWVGLPAVRGPKSTAEMYYLDEIYRARAEKAGIPYVDLWDGFVDDQGRFAVAGPDFEGQTRKLRTSDGVHFTKAGAVKLASYVDRELRRALSNRLVPMAMPGPDDSAPAKSGAVGLRPDVGPVVPLTASGDEAGDLLGAGGRPAQATADPVATKVLSRGDAIAAPAGRADNFTWPRPADVDAAPDVVFPQPAALTPGAAAKKGAAARDDGKKPADVKKDVKTRPTG